MGHLVDVQLVQVVKGFRASELAVEDHLLFVGLGVLDEGDHAVVDGAAVLVETLVHLLVLVRLQMFRVFLPDFEAAITEIAFVKGCS